MTRTQPTDYLSTMAQGYIAAVYESAATEGTRPRSTLATRATARAICEAFVSALSADVRARLHAGYGLHQDWAVYAELGHDLYLTSQGAVSVRICRGWLHIACESS